MTAIELILQERVRQLSPLEYTPEHDDEHRAGEIASAAADYAQPGQDPVPGSWAIGKAKDSRNVQLAKAGALIVAEIDRLQRLDCVTSPDDVRKALSQLVESVVDQDYYDADPQLSLAVSNANKVVGWTPPLARRLRKICWMRQTIL